MAFFLKASNILKQSVSRHMNSEVCGSGPSLFQAIRSMSSQKLFVGGLPYSADEPSLREAFGKYGEVTEARIILDRETGRSKGFGFITFTNVEDAAAAIQALDQQELLGRRIGVNYAQERAPRSSGFGGGYNDGGYGSGGGGNFGQGGGGGYGGGNFGQGGGGYRSETSGGNSYGNNSNYSGGNNYDTTERNFSNDDGDFADRRG